jgi:hypothetical protein
MNTNRSASTTSKMTDKAAPSLHGTAGRMQIRTVTLRT